MKARAITPTAFGAALLSTLLLFGAVSASTTATVTGTLGRVIGPGGETTGWAIKLKSPINVNGCVSDSLEVDGDHGEFARLEHEFVEAKGALAVRNGAVRGFWIVLEVSEIKKSAP